MAIPLLLIVFLADQALGVRDSEQCGFPISGGRIVGGVDSGGYHYPWFAMLLLKKNTEAPTPVCAGSLITKFHVLTAAHCFFDPHTPKKDLFNVAMGVYDICNDEEPTRQIYGVARVIVHERYRRKGKFYDIALMRLNRPADYMPICLPVLGIPDMTEPAQLIGFGVTDSRDSPCHMMEANVTKFSKMDCSNTELPSEDKKEPTVICAGAINGKVDSCYGDSGGPLQTISSDGRVTIAGIVSYGYGCATPNVPGIYTNVGSYLQWIYNKIMILNHSKPSLGINLQNYSRQFIQKHINLSRKHHSDATFPDEKVLFFPASGYFRGTIFGMNSTSAYDRQPKPSTIIHSGVIQVNQEYKLPESSPQKPLVIFPND